MKRIDACDERINNTFLQGYIETTYQRLVEVFGEPFTDYDSFDISDAEWAMEFDDGQIATIYNYKDGKNYLGGRGLKVENITDWHIGGRTKDVAKKVFNMVKGGL